MFSLLLKDLISDFYSKDEVVKSRRWVDDDISLKNTFIVLIIMFLYNCFTNTFSFSVLWKHTFPDFFLFCPAIINSKLKFTTGVMNICQKEDKVVDAIPTHRQPI